VTVHVDPAWYRPFEPPAAVRRLVSCSWEARPGGTHRLTPDGCTDLLFVSDGTFVLCGPERRSWTFRLPAGSTAVGVRFRPGSAHAVFGVDVSTITDRRIDVATLIGAQHASSVAGLLERSDELTERRQRLLSEVGRLIADRATTDCDLGEFADLVLETLLVSPRASCQELAAAANVSVRELHRRASRVFGYGTATLARILRFQRLVALEAANDDARPLSAIAADAGYSDHAHLVRDCRAITSMTPSAYFAGYFPTFPDLADPYKTTAPLVATLEG
jgi:AraC-like DNA-binding protein